MRDALSGLGNGISDLAGLLGRGFWGAATLGATELSRANQREEEQKKLRQAQQLANIMAGQSIPNFLRPGQTEESYTPEQFNNEQLGQLFRLDSPTANAIGTKIVESKIKVQEPLSTVGKIQADILAGRISPEIGQAMLQKEIAPPSPLVKIDTGTTEGSFSKERGVSLNKFVDTARTTAETAINALPALDQIESIINKGIKIGGADDTRIALGGVVRAIGGDPSRIEKLKDVNDLETVNGLTQNLVIPLAKQLGYNPTDADAKRIESSVAGIGKGPVANKALINFVRDAANNSVKIQDYISEALIKNDPGEISVLDVRVNQLKKQLFKNSIEKLRGSTPAEEKFTKVVEDMPANLQKNPITGFKFLGFK